MPSYCYVAVNQNGKQVKETIEATTLTSAKTLLRRLGYTIVDIRETSIWTRNIDIPFLSHPKSKDMVLFCRQFGAMLRAGVPVYKALIMLTQRTENRKLSMILLQMAVILEEGGSLSRAMRQQGTFFHHLLVSTVAVGEVSGQLGDVFQKMEKYYTQTQNNQRAVTKALIYPCFLLGVMVFALVFLMIQVIPTFSENFMEMQVELPPVTRFVIEVSHGFIQWWWLLLLCLTALTTVGFLWNKTDSGRRFFGLLAYKTPILKQITVNSECAIMCYTLSMLLSAGQPLLQALELTAGNLNNIWFSDAIQSVRNGILAGQSFGESLRQTRLFPSLIASMASVGEESSSLQEIMAKSADYYENEVSNITQQLTEVIGPLSILLMAALVMLIVFAVFLPIMNMTQFAYRLA